MILKDADFLIYKIKCECNPYGNPTIDYNSGIKIINLIKKAPTIEERQEGKWIKNRKFGVYGTCSNCGHYALETEEGFCFSNFCPNCGADMRRSVTNA